MIKICRDRREINAYKRYAALRKESNLISELVLSDTLFSEARELFAKGAVLIKVQKRGHKGSEEDHFYLKMQRDTIENCEGKNIHIHVNFDGCDFLSKEKLDTTLLEMSECFVFEELEEYTYELARFIKKRFCNSHIFWLDSYAELFFEDEKICRLDSVYDINSYWKGKYMFIKSSNKNYENVIPESSALIYNSKNVINSLCWAKKREHLGEKNDRDTILLIDIEFGTGCGLAYIVRTVCTFACMADERKWIPVVKLTGKNMYIDNAADNMWEQYFEPLSSVSVTDALQSRSVISLKNNQLNASVIYINPYFREIWQQVKRHPQAVFKREIRRYFDISILPDFKKGNKKILGALVRGTDAKVAGTEAEIADIISECKEVMQENGFEKLFLATEDALVFSMFKNIFKDKLLYIEQKRVRRDEKGRKLIGELLDIKTGGKKDFGKTYLLITYCLSQCNALAFNISSGGYYLANKWRNRSYDFLTQIECKHTAIESWVKCLEMIEKNSLTAIYGAGMTGERIVEILSCQDKEKILFCDRKAENMEYSFHGFKVIPPLDLLKAYQDNRIQGVVIASANYSEEIFHFLIEKGIQRKHILLIKSEEYY